MTPYLRITALVVLIAWGPGSVCAAKPQIGGGPRQDAAPDSGTVVLRTDHFTVIGDRDSRASRVVASLMEQILPRLLLTMRSNGLAPRPLCDPLPWYCFDSRDRYRAHTLTVECMGSAFPESYYSTRTNHVVVYGGALPWDKDGTAALTTQGILLDVPDLPARPRDAAPPARDFVVMCTHELAHQLAFTCGVQKPGVLYPLWVSEGLATYLETSALPGSQEDPNRTRSHRLAELGRSGQLMDLAGLAVLCGPASDPPSLPSLYAQCWGLFTFLAEHHPAQLQAYLACLAEGPLGRRSEASLQQDFVSHFGPIRGVEGEWRRFVASLGSPHS